MIYPQNVENGEKNIQEFQHNTIIICFDLSQCEAPRPCLSQYGFPKPAGYQTLNLKDRKRNKNKRTRIKM